MAFNFKVEKEFATISAKGGIMKKLTFTSWNGNPAKFDLRIWREQDGQLLPGKGVTLDDSEMTALYDALREMPGE